MSLTYEEALAQVTGPGQMFEVVEELVDGRAHPGVQARPGQRWAAVRRGPGGRVQFLVYEDERWSFAEIMRHADALGAALVDRYGINKGDRVAIGMRNLPEWIVSFAAILSVGAISVSLNAWWTESRARLRHRGLGHQGAHRRPGAGRAGRRRPAHRGACR